MTVQSSLFEELFALWPSDLELARDMRVPHNRARQWVARGYVSPWYWPRLVDVVELRFRRAVSYTQLVEASQLLRGPEAKRQEAA